MMNHKVCVKTLRDVIESIEKGRVQLAMEFGKKEYVAGKYGVDIAEIADNLTETIEMLHGLRQDVMIEDMRGDNGS
jgi:hypothetical protein